MIARVSECDQSGKRIGATLALMLMVATCGPDTKIENFSLASAESKRELCVPDEETREQIRVLMFHALEDALKDQVMHVFLIWLKDDTGQPGRARTGVEQAVAAYLRAREGARQWIPPLCKPG
jgi:hypothetical protein